MGFHDWVESKPIKDERIQIAVLAALGFGLTVGLYNGLVTEHIPGRTRPQEIAYIFEDMWEAAFFGFGLGFFVVYGMAIRSVESGPLRRRCIGIWLALSYFFMSWWPHATAHQYLTPVKPTDFIILEICFHWPNLAAALVLCYYQFDVLLISYSVASNNKELRGWSEADEKPVPWYKNTKVHAVVIAVLCSVGWAIFQWHYNPYPGFVTHWQKGLFITIYVTDGSSSGIACGFVYAAARITHRLPKKRTRFIAAISTFCIGFILIIATPHPVAHHVYATNPNGVIYVEYFFHLSITGAVAILGYYQHRFLVLSIKGRMGMMMRFKSAKIDETGTTDNSTEMQSRTKGKSSTERDSNSISSSQVSQVEDTTPREVSGVTVTVNT